jgi:hypothetical protein
MARRMSSARAWFDSRQCTVLPSSGSCSVGVASTESSAGLAVKTIAEVVAGRHTSKVASLPELAGICTDQRCPAELRPITGPVVVSPRYPHHRLPAERAPGGTTEPGSPHRRRGRHELHHLHGIVPRRFQVPARSREPGQDPGAGKAGQDLGVRPRDGRGVRRTA